MLPIRRQAEKAKKDEHKTSCNRATKSKSLIPTCASVPNKAPSPAAATPSTTPGPPSVLQSKCLISLMPVPNKNSKELPAVTQPVWQKELKPKKKEDIEKKKERPRTTVRKKKHSATQSISVETRTSSENDGPKGETKKKSHTSSESARKKKKNSNEKVEGSKDTSDYEEKTLKFNKELAKSFFSQYRESHKARKRSTDSHLETMPESSQMNLSSKAYRAKRKTPESPETPKEVLHDKDIFKENGEPCWVVQEDLNKEFARNSDGDIIRNPVLAQAMNEDNIKMDETNWFAYVDQFIDLKIEMPEKFLPEGHQFDPYDEFEELEKNDDYSDHANIIYNTVKSIVELSESAITRFKEKRDGTGSRPLRGEAVASGTPTTPNPQDSQEMYPEEKTGVAEKVSFNMKNFVSVRYDRHNPMVSIRKFRNKNKNITMDNISKEK